MSVFDERIDHVYAVWAEEGPSEYAYAGKATTPGRALDHWLSGTSHNKSLRASLDADMMGGINRWPRVAVLPLPTPNWEDLAIAETTLIDVLTDDRRFGSKNANRGDKQFRPRPIDPVSMGIDQARELKNSLFFLWRRHLASGRLQLDSVSLTMPRNQRTSNAKWRFSVYASAPFVFEENRQKVGLALDSLAKNGLSGFHGWQDFFGPLLQTFFQPDRAPVFLPRCAFTEQELLSLFDGTFLVAGITSDLFESDGEDRANRPGIGALLQEEDLRDRARHWWHGGSTSKTPKKTLNYAAKLMSGHADRPRYLLAVHGTPRLRIILGAWPIISDHVKDDDGSLLPWIRSRPADGRFEVNVVGPESWSEEQSALLRMLIGAQLTGKIEFHGKGLKWINT